MWRFEQHVSVSWLEHLAAMLNLDVLWLGVWAHGWVAGIASHGSGTSLHGHRHPTSIR